MKIIAIALLAAAAMAAAQSSAPMRMGTSNAGPTPGERLGTVSFPVSCAASVQAPFNRGVALLHDFWYMEARPQFERIAKADPSCAMAHWGIAMSVFYQIWVRPDEQTMKLGWEEIDKAQRIRTTSEREREYIAALAIFYKPDSRDFMERVTAYSKAMSALYEKYPHDVDAGAFYALSLLASAPPDDTSLKQNHEAMTVLAPLWARDPDNPGVDHYIIHACDNPSMARDGLAAAEHYGKIAPSGAHAAHMPGHIFARLGMWPQDIDAQLESIHAAEAAQAHGESTLMDEPHSYDFLMYAYLQSGQDANAKAVLNKVNAVVDQIATMPSMGNDRMHGMTGYFRNKFPVFYALEMRDWQTAAALERASGTEPTDARQIWWARAIGAGHLHRAEEARDDLAQYDAVMAEIRKGPRAYEAEATDAQIERGEIAAWTSFAAGNNSEALMQMRQAADLQDKVGQGEVDIPAREMLGDMLLESGEPQHALVEYRASLRLSPNRFNGLYHAGLAAEQAGDKVAAAEFFGALLKSTGSGTDCKRPELAHARSFIDGERASAPAL